MLVEVRNIDALHAEIHTRGYPFFSGWRGRSAEVGDAFAAVVVDAVLVDQSQQSCRDPSTSVTP